MTASRSTPISLVLIIVICIPLPPTSAQPVTPLAPTPANIRENQTTWYVDDDAPNDPGPSDPTVSDPLEDGSPEHPFDSIQEGIDVAMTADTVLVLDGVYTGAGNRNIDYGGKDLAVRSEHGPYNCIIDCQSSGRGFYFHNYESAQAILDGFTIENGFITGDNRVGGAVHCNHSSPTILNCIIARNRVAHTTGPGDDRGGGISSFSSSPTIINCVIKENFVNDGRGAGIYCWNGNPTIVNCTLINNLADNFGGSFGGGGVFFESCTAALVNSILWNNAADRGRQIAVAGESGSTLTVSHCDVEGGEVGAFVSGDATLLWGYGNIDADPQFAFPEDLRLTCDSPCIDSGTNTPPVNLATYDIEGESRLLDGDGDATATVDMGVYEFNADAPRIALKQVAVDFWTLISQSGSLSKTTSIRDCGGGVLNWRITEDCEWLDVSPTNGGSFGEIDEVTLSADPEGLVIGDYACPLVISDASATNSPRSVSVTLHVRMARRVPAEYSTIQEAIDAANDGDHVIVADGIYVGDGNKNLNFGGKLIVVRSENGPEECIIDCEQAGRGFRFENGETSDAVVRGFTIRNGLAHRGAAIFCEDSDPTIAECILVGNATFSGYLKRGGGIFALRSNLTVANCSVIGNIGADGGGLCLMEGSFATIVNCTICGNTGREDGGGLMIEWSDVTIKNCTVVDNTAIRGGGGAHFFGGNTEIANCVYWGNTAQIGSEIAFSGVPAGTLTFSHVDIQGSEAAIHVTGDNTILWGTGNIDADPVFVDPDGLDNDPNTCMDNDYRLAFGSPCIDSGSNDAAPPDIADLDVDGDVEEPMPFDLDGHSRMIDDPNTPDTGFGTPPIVDMGAYEFGDDCNFNGIIDAVDIASGTSEDCDGDGVPDECQLDADADADGVIDACDVCPGSNVDETIVIDGCDTEVANQLVGDDGCTMADLIAECAADAENHGDFVSCVAHLTNSWKHSGLISGREKGRIQRCAAQADIPGDPASKQIQPGSRTVDRLARLLANFGATGGMTFSDGDLDDDRDVDLNDLSALLAEYEISGD